MGSGTASHTPSITPADTTAGSGTASHTPSVTPADTTAGPGTTRQPSGEPTASAPAHSSSGGEPGASGGDTGLTVREIEQDHGASAERTRLAWRRTGMSATVVGLLSARPAFHPSAGPLPWLIAACAMTGWVTLIALAYRRVRGLRTLPPQPGRRVVPVYALITLAFAVLGGLVVML